MAHSVIQYRGKYSEMKDARLALIVYAVLGELTYHETLLPANVKGLLDVWAHTIDACGPGCIDLQFDRFLTDSNDRAAFVRLLGSAKARLLARGDPVELSHLRSRVSIQSIDFPDALPSQTIQAAFDDVLSLFDTDGCGTT